MALLMGAGLALVACDETGEGNLFGQISNESVDGATQTTIVTRVEEADVERADIFETTDLALWDGRPSLGGVWVAHPDVSTPERVRVTNAKSGKVIEAALFRRERDQPGPLIQVSSDAAGEIGLLAGAPTELHIVVLRREEITIEEEVQVPILVVEDIEVPEELEAAETEPANTAEPEPEIDPVAAAAAAAIAAVENTSPEAEVEVDVDAASVEAEDDTPAPPLFPLSKPFIQVGIFSVEMNAIDTVQSLSDAGMEPVLSQDIINDKTFWRVIVGPAINRTQRTEMLGQIKDAGFPDAYYVKE